ncbi:hypothetical protein UCDDS831_g00435 [Diplodia seriata]|uniref:Uncharacterized protein n=1 Tax=Diplodia seriata TaxID=420778 RepID=A0A0G2F0A4_9PEZI|nr:hypothetical protein UCDDS831_g00435 [Diplodia seriata]
MVSTRSHPTAFPPPELASPTKASPSKRGGSRATSTASPAPAGGSANAIAPTSAPISTAFNDTTTTTINTTNNKKPARTTDGNGSNANQWTHTPSRLTLAWLALSLPLVAWDTGYMLLRPHSMPGGWLHAPLWAPYALYGAVDHVYGFPAWERGDGFGAAQASLNLVETALYLGGAWLVLPTYMMYVFGSEIVQGLEAAGSAGASTKKSQ